jgi:hypothetical protein
LLHDALGKFALARAPKVICGLMEMLNALGGVITITLMFPFSLVLLFLFLVKTIFVFRSLVFWSLALFAFTNLTKSMFDTFSDLVFHHAVWATISIGVLGRFLRRIPLAGTPWSSFVFDDLALDNFASPWWNLLGLELTQSQPQLLEVILVFAKIGSATISLLIVIGFARR